LSLGELNMLSIFLDKMSGFFDQRFVVAYLIPVLIGIVSLLTIISLLKESVVVIIFEWWIKGSGFEQALLGVLYLLIIFLIAYLFAYLLATLTTPLVRIYEGYWPEWRLTHKLRVHQEMALIKQRKTLASQEDTLSKKLEELSRQQEELDAQETALANQQALPGITQEHLITRQKELTNKREALDDHQKALNAKFAHNEASFYLNYPRNPLLLKPTKLGNVLAAAEEYSMQLYKLDAVIWWPRLAPLLPDAFRAQVDVALIPMLAVLNLCLVFTLLPILSGGIAILLGPNWLLFIVSFIGGFILARASYIAAVSQAVDYGNWIRVAFDLYRHEILKQMHISIPDNLVEEALLWTSLNKWVYKFTPPWEAMQTKKSSIVKRPFYYDTHISTTTPVQLQEMTFTIKEPTQEKPVITAKNGQNKSKQLKP
jgi:hypothetical protein